ASGAARGAWAGAQRTPGDAILALPGGAVRALAARSARSRPGARGRRLWGHDNVQPRARIRRDPPQNVLETAMRHASTATTRTSPRGPARYEPVRRLLERDQILTSPETRLDYHIGDCVGEGGFGQVYLAQRRGVSRKVAGVVCVKVSERMDG